MAAENPVISTVVCSYRQRFLHSDAMSLRVTIRRAACVLVFILAGCQTVAPGYDPDTGPPEPESDPDSPYYSPEAP